jgi:hypothetical protein
LTPTPQEVREVLGPEVVKAISLDGDTDFASNLWTVLAQGSPYTRDFGWNCELESGDALKLPEAEYQVLYAYGNAAVRLETVLLKHLPTQALIVMRLGRGGCGGTVSALSAETAVAVLEDLKRWIPPVEAATTESRIPVMFWFLGKRGAAHAMRMIHVPTWAEIERNYSGPVAERLGAMIAAGPKKLGSHGQLLLWLGPPGTGKTYAIRSLISAWRAEARYHYITDVDAFFSNADYLMNVMLNEDTPTLEHGQRETWNLLILEDAGELLSADAKERTGQALSRLLNIADGLVGQGLRVLVLITTNEDLTKLHPAVSRPGRCAARIGFTRLSEAEANRWLIAHGQPTGWRSGSLTLAELYGRLDGQPASGQVPVGFTNDGGAPRKLAEDDWRVER